MQINSQCGRINYSENVASSSSEIMQTIKPKSMFPYSMISVKTPNMAGKLEATGSQADKFFFKTSRQRVGSTKMKPSRLLATLLLAVVFILSAYLDNIAFCHETDVSFDQTEESTTPLQPITASTLTSDSNQSSETVMMPTTRLAPSSYLYHHQIPASSSLVTEEKSANKSNQFQQLPHTSSPPLASGHINTSQKNDLTNTSLTVSAINSQNGQTVQATSFKATPVLRPSIEEVASELSKKYLNLGHDNRRQKQHLLSQTNQQPIFADNNDHNKTAELTIISNAEQDIQQVTFEDSTNNKSPQFIQLNVSSSRERLSRGKLSQLFDDHHYLSIDPSSGHHHQQARKLNHAHHHQWSTRKSANLLQANSEDNEIYQCQQYLQMHSSSGNNNDGTFQSDDGSALLTWSSSTNNHLPCACELRKHFASSFENSIKHNIWLSCDNVQLIGNQLYVLSNFNSSLDGRNDNLINNALTRFSQRDAGLQTLFSQKFHYLQLFHLKSIDLSNNRLRQIKLDAFHGLENTLEYLNLENNLLGDSRVLFGDDTIQQQAQSNAINNNNNNNININININGRLAFFSDELNRLKKLRWLSLQNNQINQLSSSIFFKHTTSSTSTINNKNNQDHGHTINTQDYLASELAYLDLSDNLLKLVPSDSIHLLNKLKILKLNKNRITQLDQFSKFPRSLEYLDLSENLIRIVRQCDLIDLPNLIELNLSNNQLQHLDQMAFISSALSSGIQNPMASLLGSSVQNENEQINNLVDESGQEQDSSLKSNERLSFVQNDNYGKQQDILNKMYRQRRDVQANDDLEVEESMTELTKNKKKVDEEGDSDELDSDESILLSTVKNRLKSSNGQPISDELNIAQQSNQFNSTLKLNLSYNFFENLPGDSLLKFTNLQSLDISFNRIRTLDSNYLCSIYNLVENLRTLDLSGNLLSLNGRQLQQHQVTVSSSDGNGNQRQLNRLFGCLQRLEKLILSVNRLAVDEMRFQRDVGHQSDFIQVVDSQLPQGHQNEEETNKEKTQSISSSDRLTIKFGDSFGSKYLNTLDLSDNQLRQMPIIEQVAQQLTVSASNNMSESKVLAPNQTQLNQWISSRVYLEVLNLNYNHLERIEEHEFEHLFNLRQLHLDFNKLTSLPKKLMQRFTSLDRLSLAGNKLTSFEPLNEVLERSARTLRVLNLANNRLMEWPQMSKQLIPDYIQQESKQLGDFETKETLQLEFALEELNLEGNRLTSVNVTSLFDQLIYMKSLKKLNLSYNLLNKIKSEWFKFANKNLQRILLTGNKINNIDLGAFASNQVNELVSLDLDYNLLKELKRKTFDSMPKLRELNLANNLIHTINSETFIQMNSLRILKLNNNKLTSWKCEYFAHLCNSISGNINADLETLTNFNSLRNANQPPSSPSTLSIPVHQMQAPVSTLIELDLSHNSLSQLRANSISVHTKLVKLNLSHNKLSFIPHDLFKAITSTSSGRQVHLVSSLKYLYLAHNRIQTVDNINFRPLKNLLYLDLSYNELQTLGVDVVFVDPKNAQQEQHNRRIIVSNNLTDLLVDSDSPPSPPTSKTTTSNQTRSGRSLSSTTNTWPGLCKLRYLNLAHNQLTMINQSLLSELSPFVLLNLNLSYNYLDSDTFPSGFYTKISKGDSTKAQSYDLVYTLKLESLDLSYNRLNEFPSSLLDNHYSSMESCNLSHNRIQNLPQNSNSMIQIKSLNFEFNPLSRESNELVLFEQKSVRYLNLAATRLYAIQQAMADNTFPSSNVYTHAQMKYRLVNQTSQLDLIRSISKPIDAPYLRHLNLSSNQLVWLAANVFYKMHALQTLDLRNNQLTRLHLLNNQLLPISSTLDYLNMGSNLFTNIDSSDFDQLTAIRHLDLSNLLSLQKLNCKFLSKLTTLKTLRMFNYPQMRQNLVNLITALNSNKYSSEKIQRKIRDELILSTIGKHCFQEPKTILQESTVNDEPSKMEAFKQNWFNLEELELELYNNFADLEQDPLAGDGFKLQDELRQLLGPKSRKLTLIGLNLTTLSDDCLLGITNEELALKISYTSIAQLPLRQILSSVAKRTKLNLDLRNNNIQTIDMDNLQQLDEFQQTVQAISPRNDYSSSLKLASNPFRCDCQTRPLWLWLNQRWENVEVPQISDDQIGDPLIGNNANYYLKFHPFISQTSDLKCFYPAKLRGKLAQHVNYNDLICKGSSSPTANPVPGRQSTKRRNDTTRFGDSHYPTPSLNSDLSELDDLDDEMDYLDASESRSEIIVKATRFNRYPVVISNNMSLYFVNNFPVHTSDRSGSSNSNGDILSDIESTNRIEKRDHNSENPASTNADSSSNIQAGGDQVNTKYNKHRPNSHQRHSHFSTLSNLNQLHIGKSLHPRSGTMSTKHSYLTESDIMILTVTSIAMIVMSFVIMGICLFKYKMDHSDQEQIIATQGKVVLTHPLFPAKHNFPSKSKKNLQKSLDSPSSSSKHSGGSSNDSSTKTGKSQSSKIAAGGRFPSSVPNKRQKLYANQILVPMNCSEASFLAPAGQNFLMRSPTIRRMHGLASNASDWFKYTLRAYPSDGSRRRQLFIRNNVGAPGGSQLTTTKLASRFNQKEAQLLPPTSLITGCPLHAFKCIQKLKAASKLHSTIALNDDQCLYCNNLLASVQQTKIQYPVQVTTSGPNHIPSMRDNNSTGESRKSDQQQASDARMIDGRQVISNVGISDQQRISFQTTIDQNGGYMPPKMIKALAKQLDERQSGDASGFVSVGDDTRPGHIWHSNQQRQPPEQQLSDNRLGVYCSRDQQVKSMRTFGNQNVNNKLSASAKNASVSDQSAGGDAGIPSQIPTIDVDGRFAYQSESQIESPSTQNSSQITTREGNTPTSTVATGQEDIFILVRDTPSRDTQSSFVGSKSNRKYPPATQIEMTHAQDVGSMMNDECSRSSSPVAYGFMRSSPSATTLSSTTVATSQNQYILNRKLSNDHLENHHQAERYRHITTATTTTGDQSLFYDKSTNKSQTSCSKNNNDYNDNNDSLIRTNTKQQQTSTAGVQNGSESDTIVDDQIIISRL